MCFFGVTLFTHTPNMASRGPGNLMLAEGVDPTLPVARHDFVGIILMNHWILAYKLNLYVK